MAFGMPVIILVTKGTTANCAQACKLIEDIDAEHLLADRGYDSNNFHLYNHSDRLKFNTHCEHFLQ